MWNLDDGVSTHALLTAKAAVSLSLNQAIGGLDRLEISLLEAQLIHRHPVHDLILAIDAEPANNWSTSRLADELQCSPDHVTRLFRQHLGDTPARVVNQRRLACGARLLIDTSQGVDDIAAVCGFADRFSFSRAFTRHFCSPPVAWRRHMHR